MDVANQEFILIVVIIGGALFLVGAIAAAFVIGPLTKMFD